MNQEVYSRRKFLLSTTAATAGGLAGCTETENTDGRDVIPADTTEETRHNIEVNEVKTQISLRELNNWEYTEDTVRDQDYAELQINLIKDGETVNPDNLKLSIEEQLEYDTQDSLYRISTAQLPYNGENRLQITAEKDGEQVNEEILLEKKVPLNYVLEAYVNNEKITGFESPYNFDTYKLDMEVFRGRLQSYESGRPSDVPGGSGVVRNFDGTKLNNANSKKEIIGIVGEHVREEMSTNSGWAAQKAAAEKQIIIEKTNYEEDEIYAAGFSNPAHIDKDGNGHGSKLLYIDGDWFHHETWFNEVNHVTNLEDIDMKTGSNDNYIPIIADFEEGEMNGLLYSTKMERMNTFFRTNSNPNGTVDEDVMVTDEFGSKSLEMIRENQPRENVMPAIDTATSYHRETGNNISVMGTPDEPVLLSTRQPRINKRIIENPEFQEVEDILEEAA
ncbi:hypothetical protein [Natranaeroarchaeum sulfidigenes]|uniref:Uncharacterized protein n=1 Tax=Natranaeroarchaeum sulfidigenes TaxID=2784880 RepID=A0A897MUB7_9EURY|nr:hypothetical protein [Natranaeroarchaeum sulfidigenes]QSG03891.1 hypothetical protein AArcS_2695 [Natranaeroarchaeum sulfidigenes]